MTNKIKWFTLIELMIVIAIMSILAISATSLNFNKKTTTEKRDKFLAKIVSIIDTEKLNSKAWKGVFINTKIENPTFSEINISSWIININYFTWSDINNMNLIWTWETLNYPFFWDDSYSIKSIEYENKDQSSTWTLTDLNIIFDNIWNNIIFSWTTWVITKINVWYNKEYKTIYFDKRSWKINF